jgi:hypothetical protein
MLRQPGDMMRKRMGRKQRPDFQENAMRFEFHALTFGTAVVLGTALLASTGPASASGGLSCSAGETGITIQVDGGVSRGMGGQLFSFDGSVSIKDAAVAADLQNTSFAREHVAQYWLDGEELRLGIYRERDADKPHGYVELEVRAKVQGEPDEGLYAGTFLVKTWDGAGDGDPKEFKAEGAIECFVE